MAREIVVLCDVHLERDERVPSKAYRMNLTGVEQQIDLCDDCAKRYIEPLGEVLERHGASLKETGGQRMGQQPKGERLLVCYLCRADYAADSGLRRHMRIVHGLEDSTAIYGAVCPVCGDVNERTAQHIARMHSEFVHPTRAYLWARDNGDPHGVVMALDRASSEATAR